MQGKYHATVYNGPITRLGDTFVPSGDSVTFVVPNFTGATAPAARVAALRFYRSLPSYLHLAGKIHVRIEFHQHCNGH
jgi:hypothetical protein